ncbi:MAG: hypothetical protein HGA80_01655 [Candidatus Omnitrophica bacterium]|nr:hypothetical protein [Candidatus Omnitrophota bacterium]
MPLNMIKELFISDLREAITYYIAKGAQERAKQALHSAKTADDRIGALSAVLKVCIAENSLLEGHIITERLLNEPMMIFQRSRLLFWLGDLSERLYDFDRAIGYYCRSLACASRPDELHHAIWCNLGFCWLYKMDFRTAEQCCRRTVDLAPMEWEGWKNLGVSLEHQRLFREAFLAYFKAVHLSRGRAVPVMHMVRLSQRHPGIVPDVGDLRPTVYREFEVIL